MKINQFDKNPKIAERRIEDSSDFPEEGNNIRTNNGNMEGKVIRVDGNMVYFKLADGRPMKTSIRNVTVIEKLADEDDEILEARVDEISDTVIAAYKAEVGNQKTAADKKGDYKKGDELYSKINKATLHQGTRTSRKQSTKEEINNPTDTVTVDVPLLIRIMEYAKEDAKTDLDLHNAAEKLIALSQEGRTLTMDDYATMIGDIKEGGMGGINRCAPSNDVSYQDILNDVTDKWRGDTVKVGEAVDMNQFADILGKQHTDAQAAKPKAKPINIDFHGWTIRYRPSTGGGKTEWMVLDRRGEEKHRGVSLSNKDAVSDAQEWINSGGGTDTQSKKSVTIDFNVEFAKEFGKQFYANISNDENRPTLMISLEQSSGLKTSHIRTQKERQTEGATKLPCISLSAAEANAAGLRPNGRYVLGPNEGDNDIMIFPLIYQSTVLGKGDVMKLGTAGLTVATSRDE